MCYKILLFRRSAQIRRQSQSKTEKYTENQDMTGVKLLYLKDIDQGFHLDNTPSKAAFLTSQQNRISPCALHKHYVFRSNSLKGAQYLGA
jgi:hypothetical protein